MGDVSIDREYAIISARDGREQIDMRLSVETVAQDTGLIFPTPAPATVTMGDEADFEAVAEQMIPKEVVREDWWRLIPPLGGMAGGPDGSAGQPTVLDDVQLGPLRATTLAASDADGLTSWLEENGFGVREEVAGLLEGYVAKNWYFVAISLTNPEGLGGDLAPLRFTFDLPAGGLTYPLALSQAARVTQTVNLYVFGEHQHTVKWAQADGEPGAHVPRDRLTPDAGAHPEWSGPVDQAALVDYGRWMTALTLYFSDPGEQIVGDLVFPEADSDQEVGTSYLVVREVTFMGIGAGWPLLALSVQLSAAVVFGSWAAIAKARRRRQAQAYGSGVSAPPGAGPG